MKHPDCLGGCQRNGTQCDDFYCERQENAINDYADAMIWRDKDIMTRYDQRGDTAPDGRKLDDHYYSQEETRKDKRRR